MTPAKIALGRSLYFEARFSGDGKLACASCHDPRKGWSDGRPRSIGFNGRTLARSAPTVLNAAYNTSQYWDGRAPSLEDQAKGPMTSPVEMNTTPERVALVLGAIPGYQKQFQDVFKGPPTLDRAVQAIAAFERTVVDKDSPFDRYARGDDSALDEQARKGLALFTGKAGCVQCHLGAVFTDRKFHHLGLPSTDPGRAAISGKSEERGAFKTPTLRNVARTAPYMHDGSKPTLTEVIKFYEQTKPRGKRDKRIASLLEPIKLTDAERDQLIAFLHALTGDNHADDLDRIPTLPQ